MASRTKKITLYVDTVSPFAYSAYWILRVCISFFFPPFAVYFPGFDDFFGPWNSLDGKAGERLTMGN